MPRSLPLVLAALVVVAATLAGCGVGAPPTDTVRVGSSADAEDRLVAEIYATGLQLRGVRVERVFGDDRVADGSAGAVDLVPTHTGTLLRTVDPGSTATTPDAVYEQAAAALPPRLRLLVRARAEHKQVVVVPRSSADGENLRTLADLARIGPTTVLAAPPGWDRAPDGAPALARTYRCAFREIRTLDDGGPRTVAALRDGAVSAAVLVSTDPAIVANRFVPLDDPASAVTAQNVVPLIAAAKTGDPRVGEVLGRISAQLDTAVLADLDRRLTGPDAIPPDLLARDWLAAAGVG